MNRYAIFFSSILAIIIFGQCARSYNNPQNYLDDITQHQEIVFEALDSLDFLVSDSSVADFDFEEVSDYVLWQIENSTEFLQIMGTFQGDDSLRQQILSLFDEIITLVNTDYRSLYKQLKKPIDQWTDDDFMELLLIYEGIDDKIHTKNAELMETKAEFIDKYIKIEN